jgi:hypothetical protein
VGEFSADWLALREPADARARSAELVALVVERLRATSGARLVLDLATGTGSNVRYLAGRLESPLGWRLTDRDPVLLGEVVPRLSAWAAGRGAVVSGSPSGVLIRGAGLECHVETRRVDLARLTDDGLFADSTLVTASALLDLVSSRFVDALAARCRRVGAVVHFALTYDGRWSAVPADPDDELLRGLVNRHQRSVKGFGKALGPDAAAYAVRAFGDAGYEVRTAASDWRLGAADAALQRALVGGWAQAAAAIERAASPAIERWKLQRLEWIRDGVSEIAVGHRDLTGWMERIR